jgi:methyl-accepting chemotaxis protein
MNIAIVGAGDGGRALLSSLTDHEEIQVNRIIDRNFEAPGILLAKELEIPYSEDLMSIQCMDTDVIIEATGSATVMGLLRDHYANCTIIDSQGAYLLMMLVNRDLKRMEAMNRQLEAITATSGAIDALMASSQDSVASLEDISHTLLDTTEKSNTYIEESDKIIQYVDKIAQKTKILGLNANIEAARAGEAGKGFSVVAVEIQKLANNSKSFADEIREILGQLAGELRSIDEEVNRLNDLTSAQSEITGKVNAEVSSLVKETKKA